MIRNENKTVKLFKLTAHLLFYFIKVICVFFVCMYGPAFLFHELYVKPNGLGWENLNELMPYIMITHFFSIVLFFFIFMKFFKKDYM